MIVAVLVVRIDDVRLGNSRRCGSVGSRQLCMFGNEFGEISFSCEGGLEVVAVRC